MPARAFPTLLASLLAYQEAHLDVLSFVVCDLGRSPLRKPSPGALGVSILLHCYLSWVLLGFGSLSSQHICQGLLMVFFFFIPPPDWTSIKGVAEKDPKVRCGGELSWGFSF